MPLQFLVVFLPIILFTLFFFVALTTAAKKRYNSPNTQTRPYTPSSTLSNTPRSHLPYTPASPFGTDAFSQRQTAHYNAFGSKPLGIRISPSASASAPPANSAYQGYAFTGNAFPTGSYQRIQYPLSGETLRRKQEELRDLRKAGILTNEEFFRLLNEYTGR